MEWTHSSVGLLFCIKHIRVDTFIDHTDLTYIENYYFLIQYVSICVLNVDVE